MKALRVALLNCATLEKIKRVEAAASKLPSLKPEGDRPEVLAATGTDGSRKHTIAPVLIQSGCSAVQRGASREGATEGEPPGNKAQSTSMHLNASASVHQGWME
jgi:hypothetical protein